VLGRRPLYSRECLRFLAQRNLKKKTIISRAVHGIIIQEEVEKEVSCIRRESFWIDEIKESDSQLGVQIEKDYIQNWLL